MDERYDVIIIGAGQAGLAAAYEVQKRTPHFLVLDGASRIGASWRERYDSLVLFTPAEYDGLPGLPMELPPGALPNKDQFADYLERYAAHFAFPVRLGEKVCAVERVGDHFAVRTDRGSYGATRVIVASGAFQLPNIPSYPGQDSARLVQLHSSTYRNPRQLPDGPVLVVGGGNSAAQIAEELSADRPVTISLREPLRFRATRVLGKSFFYWADKLGLLNADANSWIARRLRRGGDPIFGGSLESALARGAVELRSEIERFEGDKVHFRDGVAQRFAAIVWSTGFKSSYPWLRVPGALDEQGAPLHEGGISPVAGLAFLGLPWQRARSSALIMGAGRDAAFVVGQLLGRASAARDRATPHAAPGASRWTTSLARRVALG